MIAIKDMEMPSYCGKCPLVEKQRDMYGLNVFYCNKTERMVCEKEIDNDCPLIEIPDNPIDKFKIITKIAEKWMNNFPNDYEQMDRVIHSYSYEYMAAVRDEVIE